MLNQLTNFTEMPTCVFAYSSSVNFCNVLDLSKFLTSLVVGMISISYFISSKGWKHPSCLSIQRHILAAQMFSKFSIYFYKVLSTQRHCKNTTSEITSTSWDSSWICELIHGHEKLLNSLTVLLRQNERM